MEATLGNGEHRVADRIEDAVAAAVARLLAVTWHRRAADRLCTGSTVLRRRLLAALALFLVQLWRATVGQAAGWVRAGKGAGGKWERAAYVLIGCVAVAVTVAVVAIRVEAPRAPLLPRWVVMSAGSLAWCVAAWLHAPQNDQVEQTGEQHQDEYADGEPAADDQEPGAVEERVLEGETASAQEFMDRVAFVQHVDREIGTANGVSLAQLADSLGLDKTVVRARCEEFGVPIRPAVAIGRSRPTGIHAGDFRAAFAPYLNPANPAAPSPPVTGPAVIDHTAAPFLSSFEDGVQVRRYVHAHAREAPVPPPPGPADATPMETVEPQVITALPLSSTTSSTAVERGEGRPELKLIKNLPPAKEG